MTQRAREKLRKSFLGSFVAFFPFVCDSIVMFFEIFKSFVGKTFNFILVRSRILGINNTTVKIYFDLDFLRLRPSGFFRHFEPSTCLRSLFSGSYFSRAFISKKLFIGVMCY